MDKENISLRAAILNASRYTPGHNGSHVDLTPYMVRSAGEVEKVTNQTVEYVPSIESNLVLAKAGATILSGLTNEVTFAQVDPVKARWASEDPVQQSNASVAAKFSGKRLVATVDISEELLVSTNPKFEDYVRQLIERAILVKLENTIFSSHKASDGIPAGVFAEAESLGELSWENLVSMETEVDTASAVMGNLSYITNPTLYGAAKLKIKDATGAGGMVAGLGVNGYDVHRTSNVPNNLGVGEDEHGVIFGNWEDFFIGQWGEITTVVDRKQFAIDGLVRLTINSWWDFGAIHPESFAAYTVK